MPHRSTTRRWLSLALRGIPDLSAEALGLYRIVFAGLVIVAIQLGRLPPDPFPRALHLRTSGPANWELFHWLASRPDVVDGLERVLLVSLLFFAAGLLTRISVSVAIAGFIIWILVRLQHSGVHDWAVFVPVAIGILPVGWGDAFSVDETIRRWRGRQSPGGRHGKAYGFGVWLPGFVLGLALAGAAFAKLRQSGLAWIAGGAVKYHLLTDARNAPVSWGLWVASHHWAAVVLSFGAVSIEASVIAASFVRRAALRALFPFAALALFAGFYLLQHEFWIAWWILCSSLLPWGAIFEAVASRLPVTVALIEGDCSLCRYSARVLHGLDWFNRIEFLDAEADARGRAARSVPSERAFADLHVAHAAGKGVTTGYRPFLMLARSIPLAWPLTPFAVLLPVVMLGNRFYGRIVRSRQTQEAGGIDGGSDRAKSSALSTRAIGALDDAAVRPLQVLMIGLVCLQQVVASTFRVEIQPWLSDYAMYAGAYSSTQAFDAANPVKRVYHIHRDTGDGLSEDVTQILDDIPEADVVVIDAVQALLGNPELEPQRRARLQAVAEEFRTRSGHPLGRVILLMDEEAFDWKRGRFYWKKRAEPVATLDTDALVLTLPAR